MVNSAAAVKANTPAKTDTGTGPDWVKVGKSENQQEIVFDNAAYEALKAKEAEAKKAADALAEQLASMEKKRREMEISSAKSLVEKFGISPLELFSREMLQSLFATGAAVSTGAKRGRKPGSVSNAAPQRPYFYNANAADVKTRYSNGVGSPEWIKVAYEGNKLKTIMVKGSKWEGKWDLPDDKKPKWVVQLVKEGVSKEEISKGLTFGHVLPPEEEAKYSKADSKQQELTGA